MNTILLTALGLSMDACAASIALSARHKSIPRLLFAALAFGIFQGLMPVFGFLVGLPFKKWIAPVDHWVAFFILFGLGANMLFNLKKEHELEEKSGALTFKLIGALAVATSIDAFVVGIGFHALEVGLLSSVLVIGVVTVLISCLGIVLGRFFKKSLATYSEKLGGIILISLGVKILVGHLLGL